MPKRPTSKICNKCRQRYTGRFCSCSPDTRPSSFDRGYDAQWRKVRISTLINHGIPEDQWPLYAVDHNPRYDQNIEPDHTRYTLTPRLIADHNSKTATEDTPRDPTTGVFVSKDTPIVEAKQEPDTNIPQSDGDNIENESVENHRDITKD